MTTSSAPGTNTVVGWPDTFSTDERGPAAPSDLEERQ